MGHVDHGKSTFIGRFLYDTKNLTPDRIADIKEAGRQLGRKPEFAHVMDQFQIEREQSITIDTSQAFFRLDNQPFVFVDAPGHKEYLKNMITGATQAEHAILIVAADEGIREQTDKHVQILKLLGILDPAILISKMDLVGFDEAQFRDHESQIQTLLANRGLSPSVIIPICAYEGDNVVSRTNKMPWYAGPTVLEFLNTLTKISCKPKDTELRFPVQIVHEVNGDRLILGRVEEGVVKKGQRVVAFPSGRRLTIQKLLKFNQTFKTAGVGESIALVVKDPGTLKRGDILCANPEAAQPVIRFSAHTYWAVEQPLREGDELIMECRTQSAVCQVTRLSDELETSSLPQLSAGDIGNIEFVTKEKLLLDQGGPDRPLSRLVLRRGGQAVGCGVVSTIQRGS